MQFKIARAHTIAEQDRQQRHLISAQLNNLAVSLEADRKIAAATALWRRAVAINPADAQAKLSLAVVLVNENRVDEALALIDDTHIVDYKVHLVRSFAHQLRGNYAEGVADAFKSDELDAGNITGRGFGAFTTLLMGDWFATGWEAYERAVLSKTSFGPWPRWEGESVEQLLVVADQGQGDVINFARYIPWAAKRCKKLIFSVPPLMFRLLHRYQKFGQVVIAHAGLEASAQIGLTGLPRLAGTRPDTVPPDPGLLFAEPFAFPPKESGKLRVGIVWAGNSQYARDRWRSMDLEPMLALAGNSAVDLFSLQVGARSIDIAQAGAQCLVTDLSGRIAHEWAAAAGAINALDAIVTSDTAIAHLAGALGKRTFLCLPQLCDWRWLLERSDTPWYPRMTLVRQKKLREWDEVIAQVAELLAAEL